MANYDVIIVGAGLAGCAAAYTAAKGGLKTLVIERGKKPGEKNMTGGRLYAHSLEELIPGFAREAPVERCVTTERVSFLTEKEAVTLEYAGQIDPDFAKRSYTVLRSKFDPWLWSMAEQAGAQLLPGTRAQDLIKDNWLIEGVVAGKTEYRAPVTIIADGVNSMLAQRAGLGEKTARAQVAIGVKEVIKFDERTMIDRFGCIGDAGLAWLFAGSPTNGHLGGGFLYTNKDSVSVGLVLGLEHTGKDKPSVTEMFNNFKRHPAISPLLEGGEAVRYPAHMVPEGGIRMMPQLLGNGVMVAGDAAAMCINLGYTVRGMDFAIAAGRYAAEAALKAHQVNDYSFGQLALYRDLLAKSFVLEEMKLYSDAPGALDNPRVFTTYPKLASGILKDVFTVDGTPRSLVSKLWQHASETGAINMIKDGIQILQAL